MSATAAVQGPTVVEDYWMRSLILILSSIVAGCLGIPPAGTPAVRDVRWPGAARAAASLTYDDALESQLANAVPELDKRRLRATFFLSGTSGSVKNHRERWVAVARKGHELASHTIFHPCSRSFDWVPKGFALEDYTAERMSKELDESIALVRELTEREGPLTFAYPCTETFIGEPANRSSYAPLIDERFLASRGKDVSIPGTVSPPNVLWSEEAEVSGPVSVEWVKKAEREHRWVVFVFHGIGGDYIPTSIEAHRELLDYLAKNRRDVWTAPFGEVAAFLKSRQP